MSLNLTKVSTYLKLLLDTSTSPEQRFGLLYTANVQQIGALVEIFHNLLHGDLTFNNKINSLIQKRKKILQNFSNPKRPIKSKVRALRTHFRYFANVLCEINSLILPHLK